VRTADAGNIDSYKGAVPADVVMMVGVLGNISDADVERTIKTAPQLCFPGTTLLWSRSRGDGDDRNDAVRSGFTQQASSNWTIRKRETQTLRPDPGPIPGRPPRLEKPLLTLRAQLTRTHTLRLVADQREVIDDLIQSQVARHLSGSPGRSGRRACS
jgi:hypothetical protein